MLVHSWINKDWLISYIYKILLLMCRRASSIENKRKSHQTVPYKYKRVGSGGRGVLTSENWVLILREGGSNTSCSDVLWYVQVHVMSALHAF